LIINILNNLFLIFLFLNLPKILANIMKRTLLITLTLIPFFGMSQTTKPIDGFLGIKFGSDAETVKAAIKAKGGIFMLKSSKPDLLEFMGVKLGHRTASMFAVKLIDNKAFEADFFFDPELEAKAIDEYDALGSDINEVYGKGEATKKFKSPYSDGDGFELTAIKSGSADYQTVWQSGDNTISESIDNDLSTELTYQDGPLVHQAISRQKAKEKSDYK
jgi:hypothetical protein